MLRNDDNEEKRIVLRQFEDFSESYTESVLDTHNTTLKYQKAVQESDKAMADMEAATKAVRRYIIDCIVTNAPNAGL
jgi:hypothetical protein